METPQKSPVANKLLPSLMVKASNAYGDVAKNVKMPPEIESQMARTSLRSILKQVAKSITPADVQQLNAALNKIKKDLIYNHTVPICQGLLRFPLYNAALLKRTYYLT